MEIDEQRHIALVRDPPEFVVTLTDKKSHSISGHVDEVTAWDPNGSEDPRDWTVSETERYLKFYMKWDGCHHIWFGDEGDDGPDAYLHLCGSSCWDKHIALMAWLWQFAEAEIEHFNAEVAVDSRWAPILKTLRMKQP